MRQSCLFASSPLRSRFTKSKVVDMLELQQQEVDALAVDREQWLHIYQQMLKIRVFEEHANELYTSAKMPGLAHLYIGEEAIAVGMCEALRQDDYITSTHRGHG